MAYNVTALTDYTQANEKELLTRAVLQPKTVALITAKGNVMTGVKTKSTLPNFDTDAVFQDGRACGFTPNGATSFNGREVTVGSVKVQEGLCPADVEAKYLQLELAAGSDYTDIVFAKDYSELKAKKIAKALEKAVWSGDTASSDPNLKRFDGFRKIIKAATGVIDGNVDHVTSITQANVIAVLTGIYKSFPEDIIDNDDNFIMVPQEVLRMYTLAMIALNNFHHDAETADGVATLLGTNIKIYGTPGLNGTNEIYASHWGNMYFATDLLSEDEKYELWYSKETELVKFSARFKAGVQIAFPEETVKFALAVAP